MLTRDAILAVDDAVRETVAVKEWGGDVIVKSLSAEQARRLFGMAKSANDADDTFAVPLVAMSMVDAADKPLFTEADVAALRTRNWFAVRRVFDVACRLNGFGEAAARELEKNSGGTA
jgi:hypothetical protein